jgi:formylglycine-generating enzyme required for sulfatase activity
LFVVLGFSFCAFVCAPLSASAISIDWVPVGNPGNRADTTGYGAVEYSYNIGKYDVTNTQYVTFLNSNDLTGTNPLQLYNSNMSNPTYGGINYNSGAANGSKYSVISGKGENPVNYVTFYNALRFANWLNNGQTPGSTETGAYTLLGGTPTPSDGNSITRNSGATVFLPSEDEWYKAAYYNPATNQYFRYPTKSTSGPIATTPTSAPNSANFFTYNLTAVGAYTGTTSPYGAYDMAGNVFQWDEALINGPFRGLRGGSFNNGATSSLSSERFALLPSVQDYAIGFRVAAVIPEPSTDVMAAISCCLLGLLRKRFRKP